MPCSRGAAGLPQDLSKVFFLCISASQQLFLLLTEIIGPSEQSVLCEVFVLDFIQRSPSLWEGSRVSGVWSLPKHPLVSHTYGDASSFCLVFTV